MLEETSEHTRLVSCHCKSDVQYPPVMQSIGHTVLSVTLGLPVTHHINLDAYVTWDYLHIDLQADKVMSEVQKGVVASR